MTDAECTGCRIVRGELSVPGGVLARAGGLALHAVAGPSPLRGWLVLTSERHARAWYDLDADALAAVGPFAARVMNAQRSALGAEHVYAFAIGDVLRHFHLHLVPRFAGTPEHLRARGAFDARREEMLGERELADAAETVARALREG